MEKAEKAEDGLGRLLEQLGLSEHAAAFGEEELSLPLLRLGPFARYVARSTAAAREHLALPVAAMVLAVATTIGMAVLVTSFHIPEDTLVHAGERLVPRGPDATNKVTAGNWTFVHYLLHMHGEKTLQPFVTKDAGQYAMFNGEIYNYRDIRRQSATAARKDPFTSDGQALLPAYQLARATSSNHTVVAERFISSLDGEFAVVLLDLTEGVLILGTDPFATKPLYYASVDGRFAAASYHSAVQ